MNFYPHRTEDFSVGTRVVTLPMVYILATSGFEHIKIGKTISPKQRFINIQSGCPFSLSLWASIRTPSADAIEKVLHEKLSHCRTRGEWFRPSGGDLDYLMAFFAATNANVREISHALL